MVDRDATTAERRAGVAEELVYDDLASGDGPPLLRSKVDAYVRRTVGNRFVPESRRREWERRAAAGEQLTLFSLAAELDVTERVVADGLRDRP
jgi:hypothetical protein